MQGKFLKMGKESSSETGLLRSDLFHLWWRAARPASSVITLAPLVLAFIAAGKYRGMWEGLIFFSALLVAFTLHLNTNFCYHLFGTEEGKNSHDSGPRLKDIFTAKAILQVVGGLYAFALLLTCLVVWITGLNALLVFVLIAMFSSFYYVMPPINLRGRGFGEVLMFLNLGLIGVGGTYYALTGEFSLQPLALAIPVGIMAAMIVFYRGIISFKEDISKGRKTFVSILGPEKAVFSFTMAWPGIWLLLIMLWFSGLCSWQVLFGIIFSFPFYMKLVSDLNYPELPDSRQSVGKYFTTLMYLACGISLIVAVAYTVPHKCDTAIQISAPVSAPAPAPAPAPVPVSEPEPAPVEPVPAPEPELEPAPAPVPAEIPAERIF